MLRSGKTLMAILTILTILSYSTVVGAAKMVFGRI